MDEQRDGAITDEELVAYSDGDAPDLAARVAADPERAALAADYARIGRGLARALARFDCPTPHELGEYELGFDGADERARIAAHLRRCPRCADELRALRTFLTLDDAPPAARTAGPLRRIVATLLGGPGGTPAFALRGAADQATRSYAAPGLTITLDLSPLPGGGVTLLGLLLPDDEARSVAGATVTLAGVTNIAPTTTADDLGNFAFETVAPGDYRLEVQFGDDLVAIDALQIDA